MDAVLVLTVGGIDDNCAHAHSRVQQLPCPVRRPMRFSPSHRGAALAFLSAHPEAAAMAEWHGKSRYYRRKRSRPNPKRRSATIVAIAAETAKPEPARSSRGAVHKAYTESLKL